MSLRGLESIGVMAVHSRLTIAAGGEPVWTSREARSVARDILSGRRFRGIDPPTPLEGLFARIGEGLLDFLRWLGEAIDSIALLFPGGRLVFWAFVGVLIVLMTVFFASRIAHRGARLRTSGLRRGGGRETEDPSELERLADEAERSGRLERAIRLRFKAGLLRLGATGAIEWRPSLTTGEVAARLRSRVFDEVARTFDEVVYGGRDADERDVEQSRVGWSSLAGAS